MLVDDKPPLDEGLLIHYGVPGMRWGHRKREETSGGRRGGVSKLTPHDLKVLKAAGVSPDRSESLKAKYGPGSNKPSSEHHLTDRQKQVLAGVAITVGVGAAVYYLHRAGVLDKIKPPNPFAAKYGDELARVGKAGVKPDGLTNFERSFKDYQNTLASRQFGYSKAMVDNLSDEDITLKAGHIFKRVSTEMERDIRPGGFYASHTDADAARYKAILPTFWKSWGYSAETGYVVNLKAKADIKAPSPKKTFEMLKSVMNDEIEVQNPNIFSPTYGQTLKVKFKDAFVAAGDDEAKARQILPQFAGAWANQPGNNKFVDHFFNKVKTEGYNALPDMNDAGALAKSPLRVLDGSLFSVEGHETLSRQAIQVAQDNIQALKHLAIRLGEEVMGMLVDDKPPLDEDLLIHFGVPGMKWGHRKARETSGPRSGRSSGPSGGSGSGRAAAPQKKGWSTKKKVAVAGAGVGIAVGAAAAAYILMKRGGVKTGAVSKIVAKVESKAASGTKSPWPSSSPAKSAFPRYSTYPMVGDPSPHQMRLAAGMAANRNALDRVGAQRLTESVWRSQVNLARTNRINSELSKETLGNLDWVRQKLADPNHVWKL